MSAAASQPSEPAGDLPLKPAPATHFRWVICALLFFATTLNYMDRQVLSLLKPTLQDPIRGIGLTEVQFAAIVAGIGACCGSVAMTFFGLFVGFILQITKGNYTPVFLLAGTAYLLAIFLIQLLAPRLEEARLV